MNIIDTKAMKRLSWKGKWRMEALEFRNCSNQGRDESVAAGLSNVSSGVGTPDEGTVSAEVSSTIVSAEVSVANDVLRVRRVEAVSVPSSCVIVDVIIMVGSTVSEVVGGSVVVGTSVIEAAVVFGGFLVVSGGNRVNLVGASVVVTVRRVGAAVVGFSVVVCGGQSVGRNPSTVVIHRTAKTITTRKTRMCEVRKYCE